MQDLENQTAVVTGAGSGIGRAVAVTLARYGARVAVIDLNQDKAESVAAAIAADDGKTAAWCCDASSQPAMAGAAGEIVDQLGEPTLLFNAAGVLIGGSVLDVEPSAWERSLAANLTSVYVACRTFIPAMKRRGGGAIVNVTSSTGAHDALPGIASYVATKGGVAMLTKAMALDHIGDGIRINAIAPGPTDTPMLRAAFPNRDDLAAFAASIPIGRLAEPAEMAEVVAFLLSSSASYIAGAIIPVDGAQTAHV